MFSNIFYVVLGLIVLTGMFLYIARVLVVGKELKEKKAIREGEERKEWLINKRINQFCQDDR